jgi:hypothetical protein
MARRMTPFRPERGRRERLAQGANRPDGPCQKCRSNPAARARPHVRGGSLPPSRRNPSVEVIGFRPITYRPVTTAQPIPWFRATAGRACSDSHASASMRICPLRGHGAIQTSAGPQKLHGLSRRDILFGGSSSGLRDRFLEAKREGMSLRDLNQVLDDFVRLFLAGEKGHVVALADKLFVRLLEDTFW